MNEKQELRRLALARRAAEPDRPARSERIAGRVLGLRAYQNAGILSSYLGVRDEVATAPLVTAALAAGKVVAVPRRAGNDLVLTSIRSLDEVKPAGFGLLEPSSPVAEDPARQTGIATVDLLLVPGLAFDQHGGRLGHGRGYYDRLLRLCRPDALRVGLAFECQMVGRVPMGEADEPVDLVVTERALYPVSGRRTSGDR